MSQDFQDLVLREQLSTTVEWALWVHVAGSCIVFNYTLKKNILLLWKILFLCFTSLAKSLNVDISSEMEAIRTLWLSGHKIQRLFIWEQPWLSS